MNDLEITKKCAEAMGLPVATDKSWARFDKGGERCWVHLDKCFDGSVYEYDPLHDDAQAMAMVKFWWLEISSGIAEPHHSWPSWNVKRAKDACRNIAAFSAWNRNLNRAICECAARNLPAVQLMNREPL